MQTQTLKGLKIEKIAYPMAAILDVFQGLTSRRSKRNACKTSQFEKEIGITAKEWEILDVDYFPKSFFKNNSIESRYDLELYLKDKWYHII